MQEPSRRWNNGTSLPLHHSRPPPPPPYSTRNILALCLFFILTFLCGRYSSQDWRLQHSQSQVIQGLLRNNNKSDSTSQLLAQHVQLLDHEIQRIHNQDACTTVPSLARLSRPFSRFLHGPQESDLTKVLAPHLTRIVRQTNHFPFHAIATNLSFGRCTDIVANTIGRQTVSSPSGFSYNCRGGLTSICDE